MAIKKTTPTRPTINLDGPQGNAHFLIGAARNYLKQLGKDSNQINSVTVEMMSSDYSHLLLVFQRELGDYVDFETENESYLILFEEFEVYKETMLMTSNCSKNSDKKFSVIDFTSKYNSKLSN